MVELVDERGVLQEAREPRTKPRRLKRRVRLVGVVHLSFRMVTLAAGLVGGYYTDEPQVRGSSRVRHPISV
jgi:hypothetical protein